VPVLLVGEVPELYGVVRVEIGAADGVAEEQPLAFDARASRPLRPQRVRDRIVGMDAEHQVGEDRVVVGAAALVGRQVPSGRAQARPLTVTLALGSVISMYPPRNGPR